AGDAVPTTRAPSAVAICTAAEPTPPAAPCSSTTSPSPTSAWTSAENAVAAATGSTAACSGATDAGVRRTWSARTRESSRCAPVPCQTTSSPGARSGTSGPTASTTPAASNPSTPGTRPPNAPASLLTSAGLTPTTRLATRTWPGPGAATVSSWTRRDSGPPKASKTTTVLMQTPCGLAVGRRSRAAGARPGGGPGAAGRVPLFHPVPVAVMLRARAGVPTRGGFTLSTTSGGSGMTAGPDGSAGTGDATGRGAAGRDAAVRERLLAVRAEATGRLRALRAEVEGIVEASRDSNADDEHDPDGATIAFERAQVDALARDAAARVEEVDAALARLDAGTYGVCASCGRPIAEGRLEARPTALTCVACAAVR